MVNDNKKHEDKPKDVSQKPQVDEVKEIGGFETREEPTKHGDWSVNGRCSDF